MSVIKSSWKNTTPVCANCGEKFELVQYKNAFYYECPKCKKKFDTVYFEKILDKIAKLDEDRFEEAELYSIQGEKFIISNKLKCEIIEESEMFNKWKISIDIVN